MDKRERGWERVVRCGEIYREVEREGGRRERMGDDKYRGWRGR